MEQLPINQRLKILAEILAGNAHAFGVAIGDQTSNTQKYVNGNTRPSPEYLEKALLRFRNINAHWLLTGKGEPLAENPTHTEINSAAPITNKNFSHSQVISSNTGSATQQMAPSSPEQLTFLQRENELLREQLAEKERTIQILLNQQPIKP